MVPPNAQVTAIRKAACTQDLRYFFSFRLDMESVMVVVKTSREFLKKKMNR